ncbi:PAS domain-containing protein [uncultured Sanguibacteroides sp.]|uniref:PAS domain-containing protein n=1 Tax=uncultured Sanguibacteroides sp. TaxID=1635151 RepID=UPI0025ED1A2C|nr:PAS domain-containing protein [uncultured Sanguibacteroides sp.]
MQNNIHSSDSDFLSALNVLLAANLESEKNIQLALKKLGEHEKADRIHIIDIKHDMSFSISHEWSREGASSIQNNISQNIFLLDKKLEKQLDEHNYIYIKNIEDITDSSIKNIMKATQVRCALFLPLFISSHLLSFLSLSRVDCSDEWQEEEIRFLIKVASVFSGALEKELILSKLVKHHTLYQDFIENKIDFILRLDRKLHISYSNRRFYSLFGDTPERVLGCKFTELIPDMISYTQEIENLQDNQELILSVNAPLKKEDEIIWIKWHIYSIRLEKNLIELHIVGHDISDYYKESEEIELFKSELRTFSQNMYPIWLAIKEGLSDCKRSDCNGSMDSIYEKVFTFNHRYEELLLKIDPKFTTHAH